MLSVWKEFWGDNHWKFKKYNDLEETPANPPLKLVNQLSDWYFLSDHYMTRQFQVIYIVYLTVSDYLYCLLYCLNVRAIKHLYDSKSRATLQQQEWIQVVSSTTGRDHWRKCSRSVEHVELFQETHASRIGEFVSPTAEDVHVSL